MANDYVMAVKTIGLSKLGGRKPCTLRDAVRHNRREIQAELGAIGRINPTRSFSNVILFGAPTTEGVLHAANELLASAEVGKKKIRCDQVQAVEFVFSLGDDCTLFDRDDYWKCCLNWLVAERGMQVLTADIHRDEDNEHMHCLVSPVLRGKFEGSKLVNRTAFRELRESFWEKVAAPAGFKRPAAKLHGAVKAAAVELITEHLQRMEDPSVFSVLWPITQKAIKTNPLPFLQTLELSDREVALKLRAASQPASNPFLSQ